MSSEFVVPRQATGLTFPKVMYGSAVRFRMTTPYPAAEYLQQVQARLATAAWQPLEKHWLEPKYESSHVRGWTYFRNAEKRGVHQWQASWRNQRGDVVTYELNYASALSGPKDSPSKPRTEELTVLVLCNIGIDIGDDSFCGAWTERLN